MSRAIGIKLKKADENYDLGASKIFGAPVLPMEWEEKFSDDIIFFAQIRLADIAKFDTENRLPHTGYLYFFLDTEMYPYQAMVEYYEGEPNLVIDDFNEIEARFAHLTQAFVMEFFETEEDYDGTRLFGEPSFDYDEENELLLQFDPLDEATGFLEEIDGYAYFFFGENKEDFDEVSFVIDRT